MEFHETFSPVAKYNTIRAILAMAAAKNLKLRQFDFKTTVLKGKLDEEIYVEPSEGRDGGTK